MMQSDRERVLVNLSGIIALKLASDVVRLHPFNHGSFQDFQKAWDRALIIQETSRG